jgi:hypothetical protein
MNEIVYNSNWGGFDITKEMVEYMAKIGSKKAKKLLKEEKKYATYNKWHEDKYRYDPYLIKMVKDLKPWPLAIEKIKGDKFIIWDYDGMETVMTPNNIKWKTIKN